MRGLALSTARETKYPGVFQELKLLIGEEHAAKLVEQYGGTRLYIPITLKPGHSLCQLLGEKVAHQLAVELGGLRAEIPRAVISQIMQRNKLILADRANGLSLRDLARKYHLTERHIGNITNSTKVQSR